LKIVQSLKIVGTDRFGMKFKERKILIFRTQPYIESLYLTARTNVKSHNANYCVVVTTQIGETD